MKKPYKLMIIAFVIFLVSAISSVMIINYNQKTNWIEIKQDNKVLYTLDLSKDQTIDIEYQGRINTVEIKDKKIHVIYADCPDQICKEMGYLENQPIICLPNHLTIDFVDQDHIDSSTR